MKISSLLILSSLVLFTACLSNKEIKKETKSKVENNETNITTSSLPPVSTKETLTGSIEELRVRNEVLNYLQLLENFDSDAIVEKTYPPLFTVINQSHFQQYISIMRSSKDIFVQEFKTELNNIGKVVKFSNGTEFAEVSYTTNTQILLVNENLYNTKKSINFLYDSFVNKYGQENVRLNTNERLFSIRKEEKLLILRKANEEWKFIGFNNEYRRLYPTILPLEIVNYLN